MNTDPCFWYPFHIGRYLETMLFSFFIPTIITNTIIVPNKSWSYSLHSLLFIYDRGEIFAKDSNKIENFSVSSAWFMFYAFNQIFLRNQELCSPPSIFQQCNLIFLFAPGSSARNCLDGFADLLRTVRATIQVKFIHYGVHIFTNSAPLVIYTIFLNF